MMFPTDYNQQLLAYLNAWRQVLEALTGMAAMPPMPAVPTAAQVPGGPPADYPEQLLGYLQAWRQHLEQAVGTPSSPAHFAGSPAPQRQPAGSPYEFSSARAPQPDESATAPGSSDGPPADGGSSTLEPPKHLPAFLPKLYGSQITAFPDFGSQLRPDPAGQAPARVRADLVPRPPGNEFGSKRASSARQDPSAPGREGSAAPTAAPQANPGAAAQGTRQSLYRGLIERAGVPQSHENR